MSRDTDELLQQLTLEESAGLSGGRDDWSTQPVERLGIPAVTMTDGPNGARGAFAAEGASTDALPAVCVPCGSALGATWDPPLVEQVGTLLGAEARAKGCRMLLAPTVNLHRSPLGGRTFEAYSEDPLLTGRLAAAFIRGVQSEGVVATVKHLAGNESEHERMTADSVIDERTLRELYLLPFELAVRDGDVKAIMTAYNRLNGRYGPDDRWLLHDVVRGEWGFDGLFVTDWYAFGDTVEAAEAGLNLEMPGPARFFGDRLVDAVRSGVVERETVADVVRPVLRVLGWLGAFDDPGAGDAGADVDLARPRSVERPEHRALARRAASDAIVLLRNVGGLPLAPDRLRTLTVLGPNAADTTIMGGGSAQVASHRHVSVLDGLRAALGDDVEVRHEPGCDTRRYLPQLDAATFDVELFAGTGCSGDPVASRPHPNSDIWFIGPPAPGWRGPYSFRALGRWVPPTSGRWELSLAETGRARVLIDGQVVLDGTGRRPPPGPSFLGSGRDELRTTVELTGGQPVDVVIEHTDPDGAEVCGARVGARLDDGGDRLERAVGAATDPASDAVVVVVGTSAEWELEGCDRNSLELPGRQDELVDRVLRARPDAVVVVNSGAPVAMPWADRAAALLHVWFGGQEAGHAVADVLLGRAEPGGRLPTTFPLRIEHGPSYGHFPAENGVTRYAEGLLTGYRGFDTLDRPTRFPFGHGLSYTRFEMSPPRLSSPSFDRADELAVSVDVTNVGSRRGCEVVQCYVAPLEARLFRPGQELKAFDKVWLDPQESTTVTLVLDERAFACWDPGDPFTPDRTHMVGTWQTATREPSGRRGPGQWIVEPGPYEIRIGRSSRVIVHRTTVDVER